MYRNFGPRKSRFVFTLRFCRLRWFLQCITRHTLTYAEKKGVIYGLMKLTFRLGRLPKSMVITEKIEMSDKTLPSGGFADTRIGTHNGHLVAVKTLRITEQDELVEARRVSVDDLLSTVWCDGPSPAISRNRCLLACSIPSERLDTHWRSGGHD